VQATTLLNRLARAIAWRRPGEPAPAPARKPEPALGAGLAGAGQPARDYLWRAHLAGHPAATLERFAGQLRDSSAATLRRRLRLVDPARPGPVRLRAARGDQPAVPLAQIDGTTCGPMTVVVARAVADPVYAWWLTSAGDAEAVARRIVTEQRRIHDQANRLWPSRLGTTPWGMVAVLRQELPATRYQWWLVDDTDPASVRSALDRAGAAVAAGHPVPVLVGARVPRHWVLLLSADPAGGALVFYNPTGRTVRLAESEIAAGRLAGLSWPHLQAVVVPRG